MDKEMMLKIAERNLKKAHAALEKNYNRNGISAQERKNLLDNVEYAQAVYNLIVSKA